MKSVTLADALISLAPGAIWSFQDEDYSTIEWLSPEIIQPTSEEVEQELERLTVEKERTAYRELRAKEYPDFREYLDGLVKNDEAQIQKYFEDCLAVKAKYPKPGE